MSRLIDADEFKKYISNMPLTNSSKEMFKHAIKSQPTAYNVDQVVEELEYLQDNCFQNGILDAYENAIEIVKRGGVNEIHNELS